MDIQDRKSTATILRRVAPYLWGKSFDFRARVVLALAALGLSKVFTALTPFYFGKGVDALTPTEASPGFWLGLGAISLVVIYGLTRIAGVGFAQLRDYLFSKVGQRALRTLAIETFSHIHALSLRYHLTRKTGAMIRIVDRGVKGVDFLLRFLLFSVGPLILEIGILVGLFLGWYGWQYALTLTLTIVAYTWFTFSVTEARTRIRRAMNDADQTGNQRALDSLLNFETVKYFAAERRETERYDRAMASYETAAVRSANSLAGLNFGQAFIITVGIIVVMILAAREVSSGVFTVGDFVAINAYMIQITVPLNFLGTVYREIRQSLVDMGQMFDLLEQDPEIKDRENAVPLVVKGGNVRFDQIAFSYDPERQILRGLTLDLPAGKTIAVVGPSGSGKSTLARLIYRFYDPQSGALLIDGQDIRDVTQQSLRENIGIVPQDTVLFNDSIYYNIAYGNPDASHEDILAAARAAQIHEFVLRLPNGYDTEVGERGLKLSGGEKQRVGIARTLLKNPPILILDEATSALDTETERGIIDALRTLSQNRTVLTIAHRLSTVVNADEIIVMRSGEIVERGTHRVLLAKNGQYATMWAQQQAEEEAEQGKDQAI